ncbi:MAG: hypothetical protein QW555_07195 [Nitrososphaerota archaeon]
MLTPLERGLLAGELGGQSRWRDSVLLVEDWAKGFFRLVLLEGLEDGAPNNSLVCYQGRFPVRAGALGGAIVRGGPDPRALSQLLFEVNRALADNGALVLSTPLENVGNILVKHGFAIVSEHRSPRDDEPSVTLSRKAWRKYLSESCPRCGSTLILPLIPPDANVRKIWTVYCSSCSYNWSIEEPITEWI